MTIERALKKAPKLRLFQILNFLEGKVLTARPKAQHGTIYVHVDDIIIAHEVVALVRGAILVIMTALEKVGFLVTCEMPGELLRVVGLQPSPDGLTLAPPQKKLGELDRALEFVLREKAVQPRVLAILLGLYVWYALLWRPALSAPAKIFSSVVNY